VKHRACSVKRNKILIKLFVKTHQNQIMQLIFTVNVLLFNILKQKNCHTTSNSK